MELDHQQPADGSRESKKNSTTDYPSLSTVSPTSALILPENCGLDCSCHKCQSMNYTISLKIDNLDQQLFRAPILIRYHLPDFSEMLGDAILSYNHLWSIEMNEISKIKCIAAVEVKGLKTLLLTLKVEGSPIKISVNESQFSQWFTRLVLAKIGVIRKFGVPFTGYNSSFQGQLFIKSFMKGWVMTNVHINNFRLRTEFGKEFSNLREFWTRFQFIGEDKPCLIIKFWDSLTKVEFGLPLNRLSQLLMALTSLVRA